MESSLSAYHDPYPLLRSNPKLHVRTAKVRTAFYFPQSSSLYGSGLKLANERYLHEVGKEPFFFSRKNAVRCEDRRETQNIPRELKNHPLQH